MRYLSIVLLSIYSFSAFALGTNGDQAKKATKKKATPSYTFGLYNAGIGMPPKIFNGGMQPGVEVGYSKPIKKNSAKKKLAVQINAGYMRHRSLQRSLYVKPTVVLNVPITKKLSIQPSLGLSVMMTQQINKEFKFNEATGNFSKVPSFRLQTMPVVGVAPVYNVYQDKRYQYALFAKYEFGAQLPFSALSSILPVNMVQLGIRITPNK
jgi:hypothetical protein